MIVIDIPGNDRFELQHLVLDVNGTIALNGIVLDGVAERLIELRENLDIHILTADTHKKQTEIDKELGIIGIRISPQHEAEKKAEFIQNLEAANSVAIGNGANDNLMLETAKLGIAIIGQEGGATQTLEKANIVCTHICDALDLLLNPQRIIATLRK